jgi:hypothetical protein
MNPGEPPENWLPALTAILDEQDASTTELESLSARQAEVIERSATDELLSLLGRRQSLLDSALTSARRLEPFVERWEAFMGALHEPERSVFVDRVRVIQNRIDRIGARDDQDRAELSKQRNALTSKLANVGHSRGAIAAYASPGQAKPNPRFQDREI